MLSRTIRISEDVAKKIAESGKFGDTPNAVLRRLLKLDDYSPNKRRKKEASRA